MFPDPPPTPYPDVNLLLARLLAEVRLALGPQFVGFYLQGSLATGDFDPRRSDVDFFVVTEGELAAEKFSALAALHERLAASGLKWAAKLEGAYAPQTALRRFDPAGPPWPTYNEGVFSLDSPVSDWVLRRAVLYEHGVTLAGPPIRSLLDPVSPAELRRAVRGILVEWWQPLLANPLPFIRNAEYEAFAVLTMCRALHTLAHGTIATKEVAARWARGALDARWHRLIDTALVGDHTAPSALDEVLAFIRYTLAQADLAGNLDTLPK